MGSLTRRVANLERKAGGGSGTGLEVVMLDGDPTEHAARIAEAEAKAGDGGTVIVVRRRPADD